MVEDLPDLQAVLLEDAEALGDVDVVVPAAGVEMLAGDGDLQTVVAEGRGMTGDLVEGQIGPLAGEQGMRMRHGDAPISGVRRFRGVRGVRGRSEERRVGKEWRSEWAAAR